MTRKTLTTRTNVAALHATLSSVQLTKLCIRWSCPLCHARRGEQCVSVYSRSKPAGTPSNIPHDARLARVPLDDWPEAARRERTRARAESVGGPVRLGAGVRASAATDASKELEEAGKAFYDAVKRLAAAMRAR